MKVFIAFGSNLGEKQKNIEDAIGMLPISDIVTSFLYKSSPMYVTDQPDFYNGVLMGSTELEPMKLLNCIQMIEQKLGREKNIVNGPRVIDLDILFYENVILKTDLLEIPHPRIQERDFVLGPLVDLDPNFLHPTLGLSMKQLYSSLKSNSLKKVISIRSKEIVWSERVLIMGILNITPDSFSDGGNFIDPTKAVSRAMEMSLEGADIIDIGAQSTRPNADMISEEEELDRLIPVIKGIRSLNQDVILSCDTFHSHVAKTVLSMGIDIINDVYSARFDENMLDIVSKYQCPYIMMHSRGDSKSMMDLKKYDDVVAESRMELDIQVEKARKAGIYKWNIILDPGIGFAKDLEQNIELIRNISKWKSQWPCMVGVSRKGFIGKITNQPDPVKRLGGSLGTLAVLCMNGIDIARVRDVRESCDLVKVLEKLI